MSTTLNASKTWGLMLIVLFIGLFALPAAAQDAPPDGIYITADERITTTETGVEVFSPTSCANLVNILAAGEWVLVDQASFSLDETGAFGTTWAVLKRDDQALFLTARGSDYCESMLTPAAKMPFSSEGAVEIDAEAFLYTPFCTVSTSTYYDYETDEEFTAVTLFAIYDLPNGTSAFINLSIPLEVGTFGIWEEDEELGLRFTEGGKLFPAEFGADSPPEDYDEFRPDFYNWDYEMSLGTMEVESIEPFQGTVDFPDWVNGSGETLSFRAGFSCARIAGNDVDDMLAF
jgi:hypothetical protein